MYVEKKGFRSQKEIVLASHALYKKKAALKECYFCLRDGDARTLLLIEKVRHWRCRHQRKKSRNGKWARESPLTYNFWNNRIEQDFFCRRRYDIIMVGRVAAWRYGGWCCWHGWGKLMHIYLTLFHMVFACIEIPRILLIKGKLHWRAKNRIISAK